MIKIILMTLVLSYGQLICQYNFKKVHNEIFETPEERGFFYDLECQGDTCVSFNSVGGGYAKVLFSSDNGHNWEVIYTNIEQFENNQNIRINGGGIENQYVYYSTIGGVLCYSQNSLSEFKTIFTPLDYLNVAIANSHIIEDTIYFTHSFDIFKRNIDGQDWTVITTFNKMVIVDMKIDKLSNSIYCIVNNIDENSKDYKLNEKIFARSKDMGNTWEFSKIGYDVRFITVKGSQIWLVGGEPNGNGAQKDDIILLSTNYGVDWEISRFKLSENSGDGLHGLEMKNEYEGIAYGNNGNFLHTTNMGKSWDRLSINDEVDNIAFKPSVMVLDWNKYGEPILGISGMGIYIGKNETSVENFNSNEITPQIFTNLLNINITERNGINELTLYSIDGRIVYQNELNYGNTTLDLSFLIPGIYFAKINNRFIRLLKQ